MSEDFKTGVIVVFCGIMIALGSWLGLCAIYVLGVK